MIEIGHFDMMGYDEPIVKNRPNIARELISSILACLLTILAMVEGPHHLRHRVDHSQTVMESTCAFCAATVALHGAHDATPRVAIPILRLKEFKVTATQPKAGASFISRLDPIRPPPFASL